MAAYASALKKIMKRGLKKGEQREAYLELAGMSFIMDAIRRRIITVTFAKTAGTVYQEELVLPNAKVPWP